MGTELTFSQALTNSLIETKDALPKDIAKKLGIK